MLRDVIISCVYFYSDILFVFMIAVATMDRNNAEILRVHWPFERDWFGLGGVEMSSTSHWLEFIVDYC